MADYSNERLNPPSINPSWPPGDITFPSKVSSFIDKVEDIATEVENSRESESSLVNNLANNYINNNLLNNIISDGTYKFVNMPSAILPEHYINRKDANIHLGAKDASETGFNHTFTSPHTELIVLGSSEPYYTIFDTVAKSVEAGGLVDTGTYLYPTRMNATYFLDWTSYSSTIRLDYPIGVVPVPKFGDRLRFIFINAATDDGIRSELRKIHGLTEKIEFGDSYSHAIYDMVYATSAKGWFFTNVILG